MTNSNTNKEPVTAEDSVTVKGYRTSDLLSMYSGAEHDTIWIRLEDHRKLITPIQSELKDISLVLERADKLEAELKQAREENERLTEALSDIANDLPISEETTDYLFIKEKAAKALSSFQKWGNTNG